MVRPSTPFTVLGHLVALERPGGDGDVLIIIDGGQYFR